jgi:VIT1/CCC1 family predicted Fe2+/Mn2+ transporter
MVAGALPGPVADALAPQELERVRGLIAALPEPPARVKFTKQDWLGALAVFLLVFLSTLPVVVPFFFGGDVRTALRISNLVAIAMLFGASFKLAQHAGLRPFRTGAAMVGIGVALVAIAIALGG